MKRTIKQGLSLLLALVLVLGLAPGTAWAAGTQEIRTPEQFAAMDPGGDYILMEDIQLSVPYGSASQKFSGRFDGNGHTITLALNGTTYQGAFAYLAPGGEVTGLTTAGSIHATGNYTGGIAGCSEGVIRSCTNTASVSGTLRVGGIAGHIGSSSAPAEIIHCHNSGSVTTTASRNSYAGGIAGYMQNAASTITDCRNDAPVSIAGTGKLGAIVGYASGQILNCHWDAALSGTDSAAGWCPEGNDSTSSSTPTPPETPSLPSLDQYKMYPVCGKDRNVNDVLSAYLEQLGQSGVQVSIRSIQEIYGGAGIADDGTITYFYADPNTTPSIKFGSYQVTFTLTKDGVSTDQEIPVLLYWDADKVKETMTAEILDQVVLDTTKPVTEDLSLPKVVDGKLWTQIAWTSSDPNTLSISGKNQGTADTLFAPYAGIVKRGETAKEVTLTAAFTFQLTNDVTGSEAPIVLYKTFVLTVPPLGDEQAEATRQALLAKLDAGFSSKGLRSAFTGETLTPENGVYTTTDDIQLPTTRDFGVDGKYYPVTITTSSAALLQAPDVNNAARVAVCRPGPGQADAQGTITVTLKDRDSDITASRTFQIKVPAIAQAEVDTELALMERVKASYFDGIKGQNDARDNVRFDLSPFFEVYEKDGQLVWVRSVQDKTGQGIVPVPMEGWEELEQWRLFRSSNPNVISHENLLVERQNEAKAVTVTSCLSSETLGRYGELYKSDPVTYTQYEALAPLYCQKVSTDAIPQPTPRLRTAALDTMVVRGTRDPESSTPVTEKLNVTFSLLGLDGEVWIGTTSLTDLEETVTVYDVFQAILAQNSGFSSAGHGSYITAVTSPKGTLAEKTFGENSGWMYRVNGQIPNQSAGTFSLHDGDAVQVFYTRDASQETNVWDWTPPSSGGSSGGASSGKPAQPVTPVQPEQPGQAEKPAVSITLTPIENPPVYADTAAHWAENAIAFVSDHALFQGVAPDRFAPDVPMTRGMLSTVLHRLSGAPDSGSIPFADVSANAWHAPGIAWASELGIVTGYSPDTFGPNVPLTREQLAVMLCRYAKLLNLDTTAPDGQLSAFADASDASPWAADALAWAVKAGLLTGKDDTTLDAAGPATRAQVAAVLQRLVSLTGQT